MRRVLPFVLLTVLIVPAAASAQRPPFPDAAREWLSRDLPLRFGAMIALGDSLFNNGSCTRCHGGRRHRHPAGSGSDGRRVGAE